MSARGVRDPLYGALFRAVLVRIDPERAHDLAFRAIEAAGHAGPLRDVVQGALAPYLGAGSGGPGSIRLWDRTFPARLGLAAGFDKNARAVLGLAMLGFGFVEVGTITPRAQPGNEPPRMWRELDIHGIRNRMGFNNDGAAQAAHRLHELRRTPRGRSVVVGVNIGKQKQTPPDDAPRDYESVARLVAPYADYLVVNVSSPNTPGLRDLQSVSALRPILRAARAGADASVPERRVPLLVKIAPDLSDEDIDAVAALAVELGLDGVVAGNTTIAHERGPGGLSGPVERDRGLAVVTRLRRRLGTGPVIIGCGGITTPADARAYLAAGADLLQGYTGFIYQGPWWAARINRALRREARGRGDGA